MNLFDIINNVLTKINKSLKIISIIIFAAAGIIIFCLIFWANKNGIIDLNKTQIEVNNENFQQGMEFWRQEQYADAEKAMLLALDELSAKQSRYTPEIAEVNQKLGALYLDMGKYQESYDRLNMAYTSLRKKYGDKNNKTVVAQGQIARYYIQIGEAERGLQTYWNAYDNSTTMIAKVDIGLMIAMCYQNMGKYKDAFQMYKAVCQYLDGMGINSGTSVFAAINISTYYSELEMHDKELEFSFLALKRYDSLNESGSPMAEVDLALIYSNLSNSYANLDKPDEALDYYEKALEIRKRVLGEDSIGVAESYINGSMIYKALEMPDKQLEALNSALTTALKKAGEYSNVTAAIYTNFSDYYCELGDMPKAIEYAEKALEIRKSVLGVHHNITASSHLSLSWALNRSADYSGAIESAQKAISIYERLPFEVNGLLANAYLIISWPYMNSGQIEEATAYAQKAADIYRETHGEDGQFFGSALQALGCAQYLDGDFQTAKYNLLKTKQLYEDSGVSKRHISKIEGYLGDLYMKQEDFNEAVSGYRRAADIIIELNLNENPVYAIDVFHNLGFSYYKTGNFQDALENYQKCLSVRQKKLDMYSNVEGEDLSSQYIGLASTMNNIAAVYEDTDDYTLAAEYELKAYRLLDEHGLSQDADEKIIGRLHRIYDKIEPDVSFEEWLKK